MALFTFSGRACLQTPAHCCYKMLHTYVAIGDWRSNRQELLRTANRYGN